MANLSNKEKEQLQNAVERITDYCVDGMSPNNAIIKTAKEMKLTPDRLPVLVNAYNAGATAEHWNSYDSVREKTASFPIADLDVIHKTLYPQTVKKASRKPIQSHDEDFTLSPDLMFGENLLDCYKGHLPVLQKSASYSTREKLKTNIETHDAMRAAEKQSSEDVAAAMMDAEACLTKLAKVVNYHGMPDFDSLKKTAEMVYGRDGLNVMAYLEETYPQRKGMSKKAVALQGNHPFYALMTEAIRLTKKVAAAQKKEQEVQTKCASMRSQMDERWRSVVHGDPIHRLLLTPAGVNKAAADEKKKITKQALREEYDIPHRTTLLDHLTHPEWDGATEREYGILNALDDVQHDANLRNIQTETIFTDLINTDDFLSKQDPEAVLEAYNDILEVSPNLRGKKMLLRQALRQYMASESLDLSSIQQLQQMDKTEQDKIDSKRKAKADSSAQFADRQQKQRQEEAKLEQRERAMKQDLEQKVLDRAHQLELEKRRIASSESEGEKNRKATESLERSRMRHAQGMEHIRDVNAQNLEQLRNRLATALENQLLTRQQQHDKDMEKRKHRNAIALENLQFTHGTQRDAGSHRNRIAEIHEEYNSKSGLENQLEDKREKWEAEQKGIQRKHEADMAKAEAERKEKEKELEFQRQKEEWYMEHVPEFMEHFGSLQSTIAQHRDQIFRSGDTPENRQLWEQTKKQYSTAVGPYSISFSQRPNYSEYRSPTGQRLKLDANGEPVMKHNATLGLATYVDENDNMIYMDKDKKIPATPFDITFKTIDVPNVTLNPDFVPFANLNTAGNPTGSYSMPKTFDVGGAGPNGRVVPLTPANKVRH